MHGPIRYLSSYGKQYVISETLSFEKCFLNSTYKKLTDDATNIIPKSGSIEFVFH